MKSIALTFLIAAATLTVSLAQAQTVTVGGQAMYPTKNIVENAVNSADHTTLVTAVQAAGLVDALKGKGPLTVFAPVNAAFNAVPQETLAALLKPANKPALTRILTYHVVAGKYDFNALEALIKKGKGTATLKTLNGDNLTVMKNGEHNIQIKDTKGTVANITTYDVYQSNGVIHVLDKIVMPQDIGTLSMND